MKLERVAALGLIVATATLTGCMPSTKYMRETVTAPLRPPEQQALLVFVRPTTAYPGMKFVILDQQGRGVGESLMKTHFVVALPPGKHRFISWGWNTSVLEAELAPGRIYFAEVVPGYGHRCNLMALSPRHPGWSKREQWLAATKRMEPITEELAGHVAHHREGRVADKLKQSEPVLAGYSPAERAARMLGPDDGVPVN